jgi:hypothetical protein
MLEYPAPEGYDQKVAQGVVQIVHNVVAKFAAVVETKEINCVQITVRGCTCCRGQQGMQKEKFLYKRVSVGYLHMYTQYRCSNARTLLHPLIFSRQVYQHIRSASISYNLKSPPCGSNMVSFTAEPEWW